MLKIVLALSIGVAIGVGLLIRDFIANRKARDLKRFNEEFQRLKNNKKE